MQILQTAWQTLNSPDWKLERKLDNGDMVQVKTLKGKKLFKLTGYVEMSPKQLLEELEGKVEEARQKVSRMWGFLGFLSRVLIGCYRPQSREECPSCQGGEEER